MMTTDSDKRQAAYRRGRWAERMCRMALRLKGYQVLEACYRSGVGEIDIVARKGDVLAIVEVKARRTLRQAAQAVSPSQRARLVRAGSAFLARRPQFNGLTLRFDVMLVTPWCWPRHIVDAWRA
ncbi:MAG TPA: YraN family protein [Azospirillaceae bacterium]|nr:YraN family protein [Azospirillaceae bacterium]